jgi:23S rRNA pseudouridine1911/1915/1917 synthase
MNQFINSLTVTMTPNMKIKILYQDEDLMVIGKPAGVTVNRADTVGEKTIQDWAEKRILNTEYRIQNKKYRMDHSEFSIQNSVFYARSGIVHRLDKETSGCLIIAKTPQAFADLQRQFKHREVNKEYLALVHGQVEPALGAIRVPLSRSRFDRQKFAVSPGGRISETSYQVVSLLTIHNSLFTLLKLFPTTGRTHQIRVHLKYFGHPIVADAKYAGKRAAADRSWCPRLFLHAAKIIFFHPTNKHVTTVVAPLPEDLKAATTKLSIETA